MTKAVLGISTTVGLIERLQVELIVKLKNHSNRPRCLGQILPKFARSDIH